MGRNIAAAFLAVALVFGTGPGALADTGTGTSAARAVAAATAQAGTEAVTTAALTPVNNNDTGALALADAAVDESVTGATFVVAPPDNGSSALVTSLGNYHATGQGALLTTGDAGLADDPDDYQSSGIDAKGGVDRGARTYDVTILKINFWLPSGVNCLQMGFRFYTEEYPEFSTATYDDAFIAELDTLGWDTSGTTITAPGNFAVGARGTVVSSRNAAELGMTRDHAAGTTYDAATAMHTAQVPVTAGNHTLYLSIFDQYDSVYDSAVLVDRVAATSKASCGKGFEEPQTPTIFVPGILGTKMYEGSVEQWPRWKKLAIDPWDLHLKGLKLKADGVTDELDNVRTGDVIIDIAGVYDEYGDMLKKLKNRGFVYDGNGVPAAGETLFFHPTDWRRSAAWNATRLLDQVNQVRAATGVDRVNIIAHSQGGLVVRQMLSLAGSTGRVNRVVTLGTPYLGTPQALTMLRYKEPCLIQFGFCALSTERVSDIATNFPGFLELTPSPALWSATGSIVTTEALGEPARSYTYDQFIAQKMGDFNVPLLTAAADWHRGHDGWSPADSSVGLLRIVGRNYYTVSSLTEQEYIQCAGRAGCVHQWRYVLNQPGKGQPGNGDGLVLTTSADPGTHGTNGQTRYVYDSHDFLDSNDAALDAAVEVFKGSGPLGVAAADAAASVATANTSVVIDADPGGLTGLEVTVDGPATGLFTDRDGRRTGVTDPAGGAAAADIPGSTFVPAGGTAVTFLTGTQADGRWTATDAGEVRLLLRAYADNAVTGTIAYPAAAVDAGAVLTLDALTAPPAGPAPQLAVDDDADGVVDRRIAPLAPVTVVDTEAPVSTPVTTPYTATDGSTRYRVAITAADPGGAGVDRIEWLNTADGTYLFRPYTATLDLPAGGTLYVRATDRAGNAERDLPTVELGS